jgi:type I restriction enzyme, S subunit
MTKIMKDSKIAYLGKIPTNWNVFRIKNAFNCNKKIVGESWQTTQLLSLTTLGVKEKDIDNPNGKLPESFDGYQFVEDEDIIMCLFDLDCSAVFSGISNYNGMISPAYKILKCRQNMVPRYAGYYFKYIGVDRKYMHYSKNIRYTLSYEEFSSLPMLLPTLDDQTKIANFLDKKCYNVNKIIDYNKSFIELLKEAKDMVIENELCKIKEKIKLKYISKSNLETLSENENKDLEISYIDIGSVNNNGEINNIQNLTFLEAPSRARRIVKSNNIIISTVRTYLKSIAFIGEELENYICSTGFSVLLPSEKINPTFLYYSLRSTNFTDMVNAESTGISYPAITNNKLMNLKIRIVERECQDIIVKSIDNKIKKIDKVIEYRKYIVEKLEEYKKSLIYEAVTGKIEVE